MRQKITQPLKTKNHTTSQDKKKLRNLSGQKTITQPPVTKKKSRNLSGQAKKSHNLSGQKQLHNLFGQKKITQPLGTKKNHPSSRDK